MKTRNKVLATVIAGLISTSAMAATQGLMGLTSNGNIDLDLQVLDSIEINALNDINFGTYGGLNTGNINQGDDFCVFRNGGDNYKITPTSANGKFSLTGPTLDEIDYTVKLAGTAGGAATGTSVLYGADSTGFAGSAARDCTGSGGVNASVDVSITEAEIRQASTGLYADTLILLVSPI